MGDVDKQIIAIMSFSNHDAMDSEQSGSRYPHTRAQLSAIARHYKLVENYDSDAETDEYTRAPAGLVNAVVALLADEKEEELKALLRTTYGMDEDSVGAL